MNDRFRFRAWDKEKEIMCYEAEQTYDCLRGSIMSDSFGSLLENENYIVEQCTGLKDENGKLIYEGDIVRVFYDHFDGDNFIEKEVVGPVVWKYGNWVVNGWFLNYAPEYDENHLESDAVEVIGSIHENPELLEANNAY